MTFWTEFAVTVVVVLIMGGLMTVVIQSNRAFRAMDRLIEKDPRRAAVELAVWREYADHPFRSRQGVKP